MDHSTRKNRSLIQENSVASHFGSKRNRNSGASDTELGDVPTERWQIECKSAGSFDKPRKSVSIKMDEWFKIEDEAMQAGKIPAMTHRVYVDLGNGKTKIVDLFTCYLQDID